MTAVPLPADTAALHAVPPEYPVSVCGAGAGPAYKGPRRTKLSAYRKELAKLNLRDFDGALPRGMRPIELAKLCESARAVCESSDDVPTFGTWCEAKGLPVQSAGSLIEKFERGGFDE